jgi:F420-dependent oxidoreductase-like protein
MTSVDIGIQIEPQYGFDFPMIRDIAQEAERLGFESLWVSDHFFMTMDSIGIPCLECWTVLNSLPHITEKLRFGPMVTSQSYRNPALMANMAASLDNISGGRLYYGIGAGWKEVEYKAYGYPFPKASVRIRKLEEVIKIAKELWTREKGTYKGEYSQIDQALCYPQPIQKPHIPIWVGGMGDMTLKVAARHADGVNFAWTHTPDIFQERLDVLRDHCEEEGRNYSDIRKSAGLMITMAPDQEKLEEKIKAKERNKDTPYRRYLSGQPPNIVGTPEEVVESISRYIDLGFDHFILRFDFGEEIPSMRLFSEQVINQL